MVNMQAFVKELNLTVLSVSSGESWDLSSPEINRPGLELIGFYEQASKLHRINGQRAMDEIFNDFRTILDPLQA